MTKDLNNGIENIEYNVFNLPKLFTFANGGTIKHIKKQRDYKGENHSRNAKGNRR
jgi:hypothetical protein